MGIIMNMSSYEIERNAEEEAGYSEEILCEGWNPAVELACQQATISQSDGHQTIPYSLVALDAELFLQTMYAYQR